MTVQHTVTLLHASPLHLASHGARTCWDSHNKSDTTTETYDGGCSFETRIGEADAALIDRVGNKFRHASILEHLNYCFYIEGISRACLQELSRHRHTSPSVESTRYTLKKLKDELPFFSNAWDEDAGEVLTIIDHHRADKYLILTDERWVDWASYKALEELRQVLERGISNDKAKYCLPESYKVTEQLTINARALQNFLSLRSDKSALWEIRQLAISLYNALPTEHQYLFTHCMKEQ